jgi:hypothetical protein
LVAVGLSVLSANATVSTMDSPAMAATKWSAALTETRPSASGDMGGSSSRGHGGITTGGQIPLSLKPDVKMDCPDRDALTGITVDFLLPGARSSTIPGATEYGVSEPYLELALTSFGRSTLPGSQDAATFYYPSGYNRYVWSIYPGAGGQPAQRSGSVDLKRNKTGTFNLMLVPDHTYGDNLATGTESIVGSWSCR